MRLKFRTKKRGGSLQFYVRIIEADAETDRALVDAEGIRITDPLLARAEFRRLNGLARRGIDPFKYGKTLREWFEDFIRDETSSKSPATVQSEKDLLLPSLSWLEAAGVRTPHQVTPALIEDRMIFRLGSRKIVSVSKDVNPAGRQLSSQRIAERTVNLERAYLSMLFEYIMRRLPPGPGSIEMNPVKSVKARREKRLAKKALPEETTWILLDYFENPKLVRGKPSPAHGALYAIALRLALETGLRPAELATLRWDDIDFENDALWVRNSEFHTVKDKEDRLVPLEPEMVQLLEQMQQKTGFVFATKDGGNFQNAFRLALLTACKKLEIPVIHPYQLRHTFATRALTGGAPIHEVAAILGHSKISTTQRYAHASDRGRRLAVHAASLKNRPERKSKLESLHKQNGNLSYEQ